MPTEANAAPIHQTIPAVVHKQPTKYRHYRPLQTTSNQKQQKNAHQNPNKNSIMLFKQIKSHNSSQMKYKQIATDSYLGEVHRQWRLCINQLISEFQPYLILIAANRNSWCRVQKQLRKLRVQKQLRKLLRPAAALQLHRLPKPAGSRRNGGAAVVDGRREWVFCSLMKCYYNFF